MLLTRVGLLHTNYPPTARWGLSSGAEHIENEPLVQMSSTSAVVAILRNGDQQAPTISPTSLEVIAPTPGREGG